MEEKNKVGRPSKNVVRVNISIPVDILADIDDFCIVYGLSRSAFLSLASREKLASYSMIEQMPLIMKDYAEQSKNKAKKGEPRG